MVGHVEIWQAVSVKSTNACPSRCRDSRVWRGKHVRAQTSQQPACAWHLAVLPAARNHGSTAKHPRTVAHVQIQLSLDSARAGTRRLHADAMREAHGLPSHPIFSDQHGHCTARRRHKSWGFTHSRCTRRMTQWRTTIDLSELFHVLQPVLGRFPITYMTIIPKLWVLRSSGKI